MIVLIFFCSVVLLVFICSKRGSLIEGICKFVWFIFCNICICRCSKLMDIICLSKGIYVGGVCLCDFGVVILVGMKMLEVGSYVIWCVSVNVLVMCNNCLGVVEGFVDRCLWSVDVIGFCVVVGGSV